VSRLRRKLLSDSPPPSSDFYLPLQHLPARRSAREGATRNSETDHTHAARPYAALAGDT
jgi:hypothetical protein